MVAPRAPGPRWPLATLQRFARDPLHLSLELTREHGDVVRLGFGGYHLLSHPLHVRHVLLDHHANYWKGRTLHRRSGGLFGNGLVASDGAAWQRQRRMLQPALSRRALPRFVPILVEETLRAIDGWRQATRDGSAIEAKSELRLLTQRIITGVMFQGRAREGDDSLGDAMCEVGEYVDRATRAPLLVPRSVPTPRNLRFRRAVARIDGALMRCVRERRGDAPGGDLLSLLLAARDRETGEAMSARQVRDELVTLFVAGHETATNSLAWSLLLLSRHPDAERRLADEVERVLAGRPPTLEDLPRLEYTERFLKEVLRLYPPAWMLVREPYEDDCIGGYRVPARSTLLISPYVTHHRPDVWENPEGFDPERFAGEAESQRLAWIPFGSGPRVCLGQLFAMAEMKIVLALVTQRLPLELRPGRPVIPQPKLTLEPGGPLWMAPRTRPVSRAATRAHPAERERGGHSQWRTPSVG